MPRPAGQPGVDEGPARGVRPRRHRGPPTLRDHFDFLKTTVADAYSATEAGMKALRLDRTLGVARTARLHASRPRARLTPLDDGADVRPGR